MLIDELLNHFYEGATGLIESIRPKEDGLVIDLQVEAEEGEEGDVKYSLTFKEVYGFRLEHFSISELDYSSEHPILNFANQKEAHLNYETLPDDALALDYAVRQLHREYFNNWVDESEILLQDLPRLEAAPGALVQGPLKFIEELQIKIAPMIKTHLVMHQEENERATDYKAFFLDDNWIIFREVIVEQF